MYHCAQQRGSYLKVEAKVLGITEIASQKACKVFFPENSGELQYLKTLRKTEKDDQMGGELGCEF